jgi:hypothetical protein
MKAYWGSGDIAQWILDLGTRWKWMVGITPRPLFFQEKSPGIHWIGGWVGSRAGLDAVVKRKIPIPSPIIQPVAQLYTTEISGIFSLRLRVSIVSGRSPNLPSNGYQWLLPPVWSGRSVKLTTHLHLALKYTSTPSYVSTAWCLVKHRIRVHGVVLS